MPNSRGASDKQFRELFENLRDGVVTVDVPGRIIECNTAFENLTGYSRQELANMTYQEITPEKWHAFEDNIIQNQTLERGFSDVYEKEYRRKDGTIIPVELQTYIVRDQLGRFSGLQGVIRDISARKKSEYALRESEALFRTFFENAPIGIALRHIGGDFYRINSVLEQLLGYSESEAQQLWVKMVDPSDRARIQGLVNDLIAGKIETFRTETPFIHKDGRIVWCDNMTSSIKDMQGKTEYIVAALLDISVRKRAEEAMRSISNERKELLIKEVKAREAAENTIKMRDEFIAISSHELRTPLTPLYLGIALIRRVLQANTLSDSMAGKQILAAVAKWEQELNRISRIVEMMLTTSLIDTGQLVMDYNACDLSDIVRRALSRYESALAESKCSLQLDLSPHVLGNWDCSKLEQAIVALIENAIKFGRGHPIEISNSADEGIAKIYVRDHGKGISPEEQARLFGRFERLDSAQYLGGFGLGLYIAKHIVKAHGGKILCESILGKGTTFTIELPIESQIRHYQKSA
jgi:PAS domain S-box-containing protein